MSNPLNGIISPSGGGGAGVAGLTTANAGTAIADNEIIRGDGATGIQGGVLTSADFNGDISGPVTTTRTVADVGGAYTNQPAGDHVDVVSSDAGDTTQQITIIYDLAGAVAYENITLNGIVAVTSTNAMTHVLGLVLNAVCVGTVTVKKTTGGATIKALAPGVTTNSVENITTLQCYGRKWQGKADGATTKVVGVGGFDTAGATQYDLITLSGTTQVLGTKQFGTITQVYVGDVENTRTVSVNSIGYTKIDGGTVVTNSDIPTTSTDNAIVRWNSTTGEVVQNSLATIDDNGSASIPSGQQYKISTDVGIGRNGAAIASVTDGSSSLGALLVIADPGAGHASINFGGTAATDGGIIWGSSAFQFLNGSRASYKPVQASYFSVSGNSRYDDGIIENNAGSGIQAFRFGRNIQTSTAGVGSPKVLAWYEASANIWTNEGATAQAYFTLPTAIAGQQVTFVVQDADGIRITASAGDTIRPGTVAASSVAGFIQCSTQGAMITLVAINATEWLATSMLGTWTVDV